MRSYKTVLWPLSRHQTCTMRLEEHEEVEDIDLDWVASIRYPRIDDEVFSHDLHIDSEYEHEYLLRQQAINLLKQFKEYERIRKEAIQGAD